MFEGSCLGFMDQSLPPGALLRSEQSPDQSPALGLDPREGGARLRGDGRRAERSVPAFPPQQEVDAGRGHGVEDVSCGRDDQFCTERREETNKHQKKKFLHSSWKHLCCLNLLRPGLLQGMHFYFPFENKKINKKNK